MSADQRARRLREKADALIWQLARLPVEERAERHQEKLILAYYAKEYERCSGFAYRLVG